MYLPTTRILLLLYLASLTVGAAGCDTDGPGNCQFADQDGRFTICSWTHGGDFELLNGSFGGYIQLVGGSDTGILTSRTACSTGGQTHCFRFAYGFDVDNIFNLSVSIKFGLNESLLWIVSSGDGWNEASVPITTNHDFNVIFKAEKHCRQNANQGSVHIDVIRYNKQTCSFQPPAASPTSLSARPSSCNSTTPLPSTTHKTTTSHDTLTETTKSHETVTETTKSHETVTETTKSHETVTETTVTPHIYTSSSNGGHQQIRTTTNQTTTKPNATLTDTTVTDDYFNTQTPDDGVQQTRSSRPGSQYTTSADSKNDDSEPSNNAGVIAGCALSGVIIIVTVTLFVLVRQKRRQFRIPCFEKKQQKQRSQDDGYEIPLPRTDRGNNTDMASRRENEGARETVSGTDIGHSGDHALTRPSEHTQVTTPVVANNYERLDFTNSERDRRVYTSLNDGPDHHTAPSQPGLYEALGERRDSHIYGHTQGASPVQDSCVYYTVVES